MRICLPAITGSDTPASTQGQKLSILLARASSIAHALPGVAKVIDDGFDGLPGCDVDPALSAVGRRDGVNIGDEKERR